MSNFKFIFLCVLCVSAAGTGVIFSDPYQPPVASCESLKLKTVDPNNRLHAALTRLPQLSHSLYEQGRYESSMDINLATARLIQLLSSIEEEG